MKKETNYEHYKDEIVKAMICGTCKFKRQYILLNSDSKCNIPCSACDEIVRKWFDAPYEEPKIEIDWEKVPEDTPVYVSNSITCPTNINISRHFSAYFKDSDRPFEVWTEGKTSFTTAGVEVYKYCSLSYQTYPFDLV